MPDLADASCAPPLEVPGKKRLTGWMRFPPHDMMQLPSSSFIEVRT